MGTGASIPNGQPPPTSPTGVAGLGSPTITHTMDEPLSVILRIQGKGGINKISRPKDNDPRALKDSLQDRLDFSIATLEVLEVLYDALPNTPQLQPDHLGQPIIDNLASLMTNYQQLSPEDKKTFTIAVMDNNRPEAYSNLIDIFTAKQDHALHPHSVVEGVSSRQSSPSEERKSDVSTSTAAFCRFIKNYVDTKEKHSASATPFTVDKLFVSELKNKRMTAQIRNLDQFREQLTVFPLELCFAVEPVASDHGQDLGKLQPEFTIDTSTHTKAPPFEKNLRGRVVLIKKPKKFKP
ncbi:hypothetical protein HOH87_05565 [bacterium]|jgi:hypothetical protein|nr:hypothetical protein [bacterium]